VNLLNRNIEVTIRTLNKNKKTRADEYGNVSRHYRDKSIDFNEKMTSFQVEFTKLLKTEETSKNELLYVFRELGYEIKL